MAASTVAESLAALPADRRAPLSAVRKAINENLPDGYEEGMQFGMTGWYIPLSVYPAGYGANPKVPLPFVALASQKSGTRLPVRLVEPGAAECLSTCWRQRGAVCCDQRSAGEYRAFVECCRSRHATYLPPGVLDVTVGRHITRNGWLSYRPGCSKISASEHLRRFMI